MYLWFRVWGSAFRVQGLAVWASFAHGLYDISSSTPRNEPTSLQSFRVWGLRVLEISGLAYRVESLRGYNPKT